MSQQNNILKDSIKNGLCCIITNLICRSTSVYTTHDNVIITHNMPSSDKVKKIFSKPDNVFRIGDLLVCITETYIIKKSLKIQKMGVLYNNNKFIIIYIYTYLFKTISYEKTGLTIYCNANILNKFLHVNNSLSKYILNKDIIIIK